MAELSGGQIYSVHTVHKAGDTVFVTQVIFQEVHTYIYYT